MSYEDNEDFLNEHITDLDVDLLKENDNSLFLNDSADKTKLSSSPTLNSYGKLRSSKRPKKQNANSSIIYGTPVLSISKVKKLKQSKLSVSSISFPELSRSNNLTTQCNVKPSASILK